ncbi:hypothetical protein RHMOL_Rhmol07G0173500 [Rhododendron molle]|uniref:Uncharacterized protein n=1 Tax=Rhododendron molle TaxID=49168 RepID=A0ACC0N1G7_RHOML|nr:hypothetical protein RHMOL_Rhmol07G0173500 [Rhododendron molle]
MESTSSPVLDESSIGKVDDDELDEDDEEDFDEGGGPVVSDEEDFHCRRLRRRATTTALSDADYFSFAALGEIMIANRTTGHREVKLLFLIKPNRNSKICFHHSKICFQKFREVVNMDDGGGGNRTCVCNSCNKRVVGSYTKVKGHLLRLPHHNVESCLSISNEVLEAIMKEHEAGKRAYQQVIKDLGGANVVQIVTDDASNYKAVGLTIEAIYPHVFWTPCVVHSLNLALKSICEPGEKTPQYAQCGDQFDIKGQEVVELAQLSFDEPELERMTFQDVEVGEEQLDGDEF